MKKLYLVFVFIFFVSATPSFAMTESELKTVIAAMLNTQGYLCARVTSVTPLNQADTYEVRCIEYQGGTGTVDYILNAQTGTAFKR
jgi:hypothetical protein